MVDAFKSPAIWGMAAIYFGFTAGSYGVGFWLPQLLKDGFTTDPVKIGLLSALPWGAGAISMLICGRLSDQSGRYRRYVFVAGMIGALAFAASVFPGEPRALRLLALTIATSGVMACISTFWALPTSLLSAGAAASGIAWINSLGNLSGYFCPSLVGWIRDSTHSMTPALLMLSGCCFAASLAVAGLRNTTQARDSAAVRDATNAGTHGSSHHELGVFNER
jgi:nitrate/nitrite transporter NarK